MYQSQVLENKTSYHSDFLEDTIWNLLDITYAIPDKFNYKIYIVNEDKYIARPDLISYDFYGDPMYADVVCRFNVISNPFELTKGLDLSVPGFNYVQYFITKPTINEQESGLKEIDERVKPIPKSKAEKRRPNDAILGDKRFKINAADGIVMY